MQTLQMTSLYERKDSLPYRPQVSISSSSTSVLSVNFDTVPPCSKDIQKELSSNINCKALTSAAVSRAADEAVAEAREERHSRSLQVSSDGKPGARPCRRDNSESGKLSTCMSTEMTGSS